MTALIRAGLIAQTSARLGLRNVAAVALHRAKTRVRRETRVSDLPSGPLFRPRTWAAEPHDADAQAVLRCAERIGNGELQVFGDKWVRLGFPFEWRENVLPRSANGYDIKGVWEASRFGWAVDLARAHRAAPGAGHLARLEANVESWTAEHPTIRGDNWSCGQEAAIRVLHLLLAHQVLSGETALAPRLAALVARHLRRIERTLGYAVAQQNNHATSEAAALFVGGAILAGHPDNGGEPRRWEDVGRRTLERTVADLVMLDGGFAQYSTNYHRLMLDTLCQVELWRSRLGRSQFSTGYRERCRAATGWLGALTNAATGAAPNLGHNDGAQAYRLTDAPYADLRPSVALAASLFNGAAPAGEGSPSTAGSLYEKTSRVFPDFGLALINPDSAGGGSYAFVRFPVRRFRPAQADMLHFDLWTADGENLLIDAGTFSYSDEEGLKNFASAAAHNSVSFDRGEPMRRIGRFLYADWPHASADAAVHHADGCASWAASYSDYRGMRHKRLVEAGGGRWRVFDEFGGFSQVATLRWHLPPQPFRQIPNGIETDAFSLVVSPCPGAQTRIEEGRRSKTYGSKEPTIVLAVDCPIGCQSLTTTITLRQP